MTAKTAVRKAEGPFFVRWRIEWPRAGVFLPEYGAQKVLISVLPSHGFSVQEEKLFNLFFIYIYTLSLAPL